LAGFEVTTEAKKRYYNFWDKFSAFAVPDEKGRNELEGILIAAMPTANSSKPKLMKERMPKEVSDLLKAAGSLPIAKSASVIACYRQLRAEM